MDGPSQVPLLLEMNGHAASSDATQSLAVEPTGVLRISGVASGDSVAELNFGTFSLMVPLVMDMGPVQTLRALQQALPPSFVLKVVNEQKGILQVTLARRGQPPPEQAKLRAVPQPPPPAPMESVSPLQMAVPLRVVAAVTCDDPVQKVGVEPSGLIRISGVAQSAGRAPSVIRLSLDARLVEIELGRGATPKDSMELIREAVSRRLPPGTRLMVVNADVAPEGDVVFDVLKPAPPPPRTAFGE
jgi:hypothetical protein